MKSLDQQSLDGGYIDDELLRRIPPGNLRHHGHLLVRNRSEAAELVFTFLVALDKGGTITPRQYGLVLWLLDPVIRGEDPQRLPFPIRKRGQKTSKTKQHQHFIANSVALRVRELVNEGATVEDAVAQVAEMPKHENSVRGHYQRADKTFLDAQLKSIRDLMISFKKSST